MENQLETTAKTFELAPEAIAQFPAIWLQRLQRYGPGLSVRRMPLRL